MSNPLSNPISSPAQLSQTAVAQLAAEHGRDLTQAQAQGLHRYLDILLAWNQRKNLVGSNDWQTILTDLIADSWHLADFLETLPTGPNPVSVDLGAGAGLPGLPLRLFWPSGLYYLVENRRQRSAFLLQAIAAMGLDQTLVRPQRAEQALPALAPVDICISRAFLPWMQVLELIRPWLAPKATAMVITMANEPAPDRLPPGWKLLRQLDYAADGKSRYLWALAPVNISR
jgi:16S rRNA (guanine527-N7)-methyltransferase